jgi:hypothetical protein
LRILSGDDLAMLTTTSARYHSIDITPPTRLRSIEFMLIGDRSANRSRCVTQILSCISSAHLEHVVFKPCNRFDFVGEVNSNAREWHNVDSILQRSTFSRLRDVYFRCTPPSSVVGWTSDGQFSSHAAYISIIQRLPQCHARGILRVDQWW